MRNSPETISPRRFISGTDRPEPDPPPPEPEPTLPPPPPPRKGRRSICHLSLLLPFVFVTVVVVVVVVVRKGEDGGRVERRRRRRRAGERCKDRRIVRKGESCCCCCFVFYSVKPRHTTVSLSVPFRSVPCRRMSSLPLRLLLVLPFSLSPSFLVFLLSSFLSTHTQHKKTYQPRSKKPSPTATTTPPPLPHTNTHTHTGVGEVRWRSGTERDDEGGGERDDGRGREGRLVVLGEKGGGGRVYVFVRVVISPRLFLYLFLSSGELGHFYYQPKRHVFFFP